MAFFIHRAKYSKIIFLTNDKVIFTMTRCSMNTACTCISRYMLPKITSESRSYNGCLATDIFQFAPLTVFSTSSLFPSKCFFNGCNNASATIYFVHLHSQLHNQSRVYSNSKVSRNSPRCCCPDDELRLLLTTPFPSFTSNAT